MTEARWQEPVIWIALATLVVLGTWALWGNELTAWFRGGVTAEQLKHTGEAAAPPPPVPLDLD